mmetsp:Transcript_22590/g.33034  ORF Transcript_22590/g.33034 Transcript_22590/m.33034 type:complete len:510 (-) Transcript_22590:336-1865(-)
MRVCIGLLCLWLTTAATSLYDPNAPQIDPVHGNRGLMIDAGSGGSRLHIFSWEPRVFNTAPPPLSFPKSDEKTTERISPGMSYYTDDYEGLKKYFAYLIDLAKITLAEYKEYWHTYPIYLRATGGMRLVPMARRESMMAYTRELFSDKEFCPFFFQFDFARVMSGEEEAVYAWAAANYLFGTLLPNIHGSGAVNKPIKGTFGTVDLGGASTQIAFFVPSQDVSEGLFKLQIGSQRHWNVYAKSFLKYGHNSARERHFDRLVAAAKANDSASAIDYCFYSGYHETISSVTLSGPADPISNQFDLCAKSLMPLMQKELNSFCNTVYDGECSMDGFYQPKLPSYTDGHFIGSATYKYPWNFLEMPETASIDEFKEKAKNICAMSYKDIKIYSSKLKSTIKKNELIPYYCFLSAYITVLLENGYGFTSNQTFTVIDNVAGHKVGWALGSMLYEINGLPYILSPPTWKECIGKVTAGVIGGLVFGCAITWYFLSVTKKPFTRRSGYDTIPGNEL